MTIQYVNIGNNPNDGTGDDLRSAFLKVNDNFQLLASIGGETNQGANVGGGSGQLFLNKTDETLNFRTIAGGNGITVSQTSQEVVITNTFTAPDSFSRIYVGTDNSIYYEAAGPNDNFRIKSEGAIQSSLLGNTITLTGVFNLSDDLAPILSGSLDLNGKNIIGTGNINITGSAQFDELTVGQPDGVGGFTGTALVNGTLTVMGDTVLDELTASTINSGSISATSITSTGGITGSLTGNSTGTHYGNVAIKGIGLDGDGLPNPDTIIVNTIGTPATFTGNLFGDHSGGFTGSIISGGVNLNGQTISGEGAISVIGQNFNDRPLVAEGVFHSEFLEDYRTPGINYGSVSAMLTMRQQSSGSSEALKLRSIGTNFTNQVGIGTAIAFDSTNTISNTLPGFEQFNVITIVSYNSKTEIDGKFYVNFTIPEQQQTIEFRFRLWQISGSANGDYNGTHFASEAEGTSITFRYDTDPGIWAGGTTTIVPIAAPEYTHHGWLAMSTYDDGDDSLSNVERDFSSFVVKVRAKRKNLLFATPGNEPEDISPVFLNAIVARGNGRASINLIDITEAKISPTKVYLPEEIPEDPFRTSVSDLNWDMILTNEASEKYINFYGTFDRTLIDGVDSTEGVALGGYSFPKIIGTPGQVLAVRTPDGITPNNLLEWITPGSGGGGVTPTTFLNLTDTPSTYLPGDSNKVLIVNGTSSGIEFTDTLAVNVTGNLNGNALTSSRLFAPTTINGYDFDGTQQIDLDSDDISEGTNNLYFSETRVKDTLSVVADKSLTYDSVNGQFDISESVANVADTLIKRDSNGETFLSKIYVTTLEKNSTDTEISFNSDVNLNANNLVSTGNITTTATISTGFISLTGTGDQVLTSTDDIVLNPTNNVDVSSKKIVNLATPTENTDAVTKEYVDTETQSVFDDSLQDYTVAGDTGGELVKAKGETLTISGSSNISTNTTVDGIQISLKSTISNISINGNLPVSQQLTATTVKGGNIAVSGNAISQSVAGSDLNIIPGANGGSVVISNGDLELVSSRLSIQGFDVIEFPANSQSQAISLSTPTTFVRTFNWNDANSNLAFATLPNGNVGQIKTIIMQDRGVYGDALDTRPRYLVLSGNINGASREVNIAAADANGSSTFIFLNNYWWRIANVA